MIYTNYIKNNIITGIILHSNNSDKRLRHIFKITVSFWFKITFHYLNFCNKINYKKVKGPYDILIEGGWVKRFDNLYAFNQVI